ncbi:hypothetical protein, partial [Geitlerinema sp. PCC 9228]|uniref:hypothetical protein n=1 Tax=Geitlerinema sp. PCC 9228 TaxID=111611 RepID=UPI001B8BA40C
MAAIQSQLRWWLLLRFFRQNFRMVVQKMVLAHLGKFPTNLITGQKSTFVLIAFGSSSLGLVADSV